MDDPKLDAALSSLSNHMPRAPAELIDDMAKTVSVVEAERNRRLGKTVQTEAVAEKTKEAVKEPLQKQPPKAMGR